MLAIFLNLCLLLSLLWAASGGWPRMLTAGLVLGLSALCVANILLFLPFAIGWILWQGSQFQRTQRLGHVAVFCAGVCVAIAPVALRNALLGGELVLIFPEGTRTSDGRVAPLKPGFCALVRRTSVPLIPVGLAGAYEAWPRSRKLPRPRRIRIVIGPPIEAELAATWTDDQLVAELQARIEACQSHAGRSLGGLV